jgi:hypothetical protein
MFKLYARLKAVKGVLKNQNKVCYGNIQQKVLQVRMRMQKAQQDVITWFCCVFGERKIIKYP